MENNNLSLETFQDQLNILKLQNQLLNQCRINTSINVSMSIEECAYSVGNGNIYPFQVPHYCLHYTSIKNRVDEYFKDLNSIVSPIDLFNIMEIIASIQAPPERIHIGFLDFDYLRRSELYKIYYPLIDYLKKRIIFVAPFALVLGTLLLMMIFVCQISFGMILYLKQLMF